MESHISIRFGFFSDLMIRFKWKSKLRSVCVYVYTYTELCWSSFLLCVKLLHENEKKLNKKKKTIKLPQKNFQMKCFCTVCTEQRRKVTSNRIDNVSGMGYCKRFLKSCAKLLLIKKTHSFNGQMIRKFYKIYATLNAIAICNWHNQNSNQTDFTKIPYHSTAWCVCVCENRSLREITKVKKQQQKKKSGLNLANGVNGFSTMNKNSH